MGCGAGENVQNAGRRCCSHCRWRQVSSFLPRIFTGSSSNTPSTSARTNALMEIGSLMEDEVYAHPERYASLVQLDYDSERHVTALRTDVVAIGRIKSRLVNGLYDRLDEFEQTVIEVPLGSVLAPRFFSGRGPSLHFGLAGLTQMEAEFVSSFSAAGINQTRHCILIEFHAGFRILTPFGGEDREIGLDLSGHGYGHRRHCARALCLHRLGRRGPARGGARRLVGMKSEKSENKTSKTGKSLVY